MSLPDRAQAVLTRLPAGTVELATRYLREAGARLAHLDEGCPVDDDRVAMAHHLVRPLLLSDDWPDPTAPLPVGDGAVHADLIDDDLETLARLRSTFEGRPDPEHLAAEAQTWRLPVTPYRPRPAKPPSTDNDQSHDDQSRRPGRIDRPLQGCLVVDLTALWAGPLATKLLTDQGVRVVKVDPSCRPDGFGVHSRLYEHLNGGKEVVDLDLRAPGDRSRFENLLAESDLLVDSFSRRVMPNLGYGQNELRSLNPDLSTLSIVAFPLGSPEADWLSYGPGVHATSGLAADITAQRQAYRAAPIAYPDALAGLKAFGTAIDALTAPGGRHEVSLAASIAPLLEWDGDDGTVGWR